MSQAQKPRTPIVEDDVDDLDDILDKFTPPPSNLKQTGAPAVPSNAGTQEKPKDPSKSSLDFEDLSLDDDFAKEFAKGLAELMRNVAAEPMPQSDEPSKDGGGDPAKEQERELAFRKAWEDMLVKGMDESFDPQDVAGTSSSSAKGKEKGRTDVNADLEDGFQASIKKAMEKLKESDTNLQAESSSASADPFEALLSQLGEGGENEEELEGIIEGMMKQLMSKSILYEPLKELSDKFPSYLADNASTIKPEDKQRYLSQQKLVDEIVAIYDDPKYAEDNVEQNAKITTLMNEMQQLGSPPPEIMGPLPPGFDAGPDGMPKLPDGCIIA